MTTSTTLATLEKRPSAMSHECRVRCVQIQAYVHSVFGPGYFCGWGAHLHATRGTTPREVISAEIERYRAQRTARARNELQSKEVGK